MERFPMHKVVFWISLTLSASVGLAQITLEAGDARGARGSEIEIPILVHDAQQLGPVQFELVFDPAVLEAFGADGGPLLNGAVASFVPRPGQLNIGAITNAPLSGEGVLVTARFRVKGGAGSETVVGLQNELAFEYGRLVDLLVDTEPGAFRVTGFPWPTLLLAVAVAVLLLRQRSSSGDIGVARTAGRVAGRAREDKARDRERIDEVIGVITDVADSWSRNRSGGQVPGVRAPVYPADDIPGQPSGASPRAPVPSPGGHPPTVGATSVSPPVGGTQCVVFEQLRYGNDAHFLVRHSSGRAGDASAYYVVSVPAQQRFADGSGCSSGRGCLDYYLRSVLPAAGTRVLGSYRSRSAARRAARQACPNALGG